MFTAGGLLADRDPRERDRRAQDAPNTVIAGRHRTLLPHALALLYGLAIVLRACSPSRRGSLPSPTRRSGRSRRGRCAGPASTSSPTSSPMCRSASSSRSRRGARRRARARARARRRIRAVVRAGDAADVPAAARREPRSTSPPTRAARCVGGVAGASLVRARSRPRRAVGGAPSNVPARQARRLRHSRCSCVWLVAQINPGIPLFAVTFDPEPRAGCAGAGRRAARHGADVDRGRRIGVPARWASACSSRCCCAIGASSAAPLLLLHRRRAARQGRRGRAHAEARGVGDLAQARRVDRHDGGAARPAVRRVPAAPGAGRDLRDRAARVAAAAAWSRSTCPPRARRSRSSTGATGTCSISTA